MQLSRKCRRWESYGRCYPELEWVPFIQIENKRKRSKEHHVDRKRCHLKSADKNPGHFVGHKGLPCQYIVSQMYWKKMGVVIKKRPDCLESNIDVLNLQDQSSFATVETYWVRKHTMMTESIVEYFEKKKKKTPNTYV